MPGYAGKNITFTLQAINVQGPSKESQRVTVQIVDATSAPALTIDDIRFGSCDSTQSSQAQLCPSSVGPNTDNTKVCQECVWQSSNTTCGLVLTWTRPNHTGCGPGVSIG
jgi:hypothetical protein